MSDAFVVKVGDSIHQLGEDGSQQISTQPDFGFNQIEDFPALAELKEEVGYVLQRDVAGQRSWQPVDTL